MSGRQGGLIISLDFELNWGTWSEVSLDRNRKRLEETRRVIPRLLELFTEYNVHATWATVGFLFCGSRDELMDRRPRAVPGYTVATDPYRFARSIGRDEAEDPFHFAPSLIRLIADTPHQEIGTHTYSHMCCLEQGASAEAFRADLEAAREVAEGFDLRPRSLVFPKNQVNQAFLAVCEDIEVQSFRGARAHWIYAAREDAANGRIFRGLRLIDSYLPLTGPEASFPGAESRRIPQAVDAGRFLRPWSPALRGFEALRLKRITGALDAAAEQGALYHLWWHPHNFGVHAQQNLDFLRRILDHVAALQAGGRMVSLGMDEAACIGMESMPIQ